MARLCQHCRDYYGQDRTCPFCHGTGVEPQPSTTDLRAEIADLKRRVAALEAAAAQSALPVGSVP